MIIRRRILLPTEKEYEFVDLGLPSGLLWAKYNVGATTETDRGLYFAWGETVGYTTANEKTIVKDGTTYTRFIWETYKYIDDPTSVSDDNIPETALTKYNATDGKTVLDLEDDAAHVNMGEEWRMPTYEEFQELINNTTNEWVKNYNGTYVSGSLLTSNNNQNKLFFPAAGSYTTYSIWLNGNNIYGVYWASNLSDSDLLRPYGMSCSREGIGAGIGDIGRNEGQNIRAVRSA